MNSTWNDIPPLSAKERADAGTFACPICGKDVPHYHSPAEVAEHHATEVWVNESWDKFQAEHAARKGPDHGRG